MKVQMCKSEIWKYKILLENKIWKYKSVKDKHKSIKF